ncbi:MAG: hypothetical protein AB8B56_18400, partial [Crocinitomicaceae bacterium]
ACNPFFFAVTFFIIIYFDTKFKLSPAINLHPPQVFLTISPEKGQNGRTTSTLEKGGGFLDYPL